MPERARREKVPRARPITRRIPAERATRGITLSGGPARDRLSLDQSNSPVLSAVEKHLTENRDVPRRRKKSGVSGDAAEGAGVLVVDDAVHVDVSVGCIHLRDCDAIEQRMIGAKRRGARRVGG